MVQMQKYAPITNITASRYKSSLKKVNYPKYDDPEPGTGLLMYRDRLKNFVCSDKKGSSPKTKCYCCLCGNITTPNFNHFFRIFPPKFKCTGLKPDTHRLSFVDDPPYTDLSEFLSKLHYSEINLLEKRTNKRIVINKATYYDIDSRYYYCRHLLPNWICKCDV